MEKKISNFDILMRFMTADVKEPDFQGTVKEHVKEDYTLEDMEYLVETFDKVCAEFDVIEAKYLIAMEALKNIEKSKSSKWGHIARKALKEIEDVGGERS